MSAALAYTVLHLVIGEHRAQGGTPVHPRIAQVGQAEVLQHQLLGALIESLPFGCIEFAHELLDVAGEHAGILTLASSLLEACDQFRDGARFILIRIVPAIEELQEDPLCPLVVVRVAGAHLAAPIEGESNAVQLLPVAR